MTRPARADYLSDPTERADLAGEILCHVELPGADLSDLHATPLNYGLGLVARADSLRQASEQYLSSGQLDAHFLRQVNGRAHWTQTLTGRLWGLRKPPPDLP